MEAALAPKLPPKVIPYVSRGRAIWNCFWFIGKIIVFTIVGGLIGVLAGALWAIVISAPVWGIYALFKGFTASMKLVSDFVFYFGGRIGTLGAFVGAMLSSESTSTA